MADPESRRARFEALFREHHPAVRAYARRRVPVEVVDDIVSETFLVVWRRLEETPEPALPWLLTVAHNVAGTERRGAARRQRLWLEAQSRHVEGDELAEPEITDGRYPIARVLTGPAASPNLVSLQAQHPSATVDRSPTDYGAARRRMDNVNQQLRRCTRSGCFR